MIFLCLSGFVAFLYFGIAPDRHQTQPVYGNIVYSPFSNINHRYNRIEATLNYSESKNSYNLTICQATCPLKTHTKQLVHNGSCNARRHTNCHTTFSDGDNHRNYDPARCFTKFMGKNSRVTFNITGLNATESVQLCIAANIEKCDSIFWPGEQQLLDLQQDCVELKTFNLTSNDFVQTFVAPYDSYYCAIWLLGSTHQWLNYTVNSSIELYDITDYSPHLCRSYIIINHENRPHVTFPLYANKQQTMCIVQQSTVELWNSYSCDSISINSIALKPLKDAFWIAFSVVMGLLFCIVIIIIIIVILCHYFC